MGAARLHCARLDRRPAGFHGEAGLDVRVAGAVPEQAPAGAGPGRDRELDPGPRGGFRLARELRQITLLDVVTAIEGTEDAFRCQEIRQRGVGAKAPKSAFRKRCAIAAAMRTAEVAWRRALEAQTLADVRDAAALDAPQAAANVRRWHTTNKEN